MDNILYSIYQYLMVYKEVVLTLVLLVTSSLLLHRGLILIGQKWVATFAHTATLMTLPIVTYVLTSIISGDIALSLGMVGALSIVRFRNPVRSPFELTVYFIAITEGVAASVDWKWLILLIGSVISILGLLYFSDNASKTLLGRSVFSISFTEGNHLSTLEVRFENGGDSLGYDDLLISIDTDDEYSTYIFASSDRSKIKKAYLDFDAHFGVKRIQMHL